MTVQVLKPHPECEFGVHCLVGFPPEPDVRECGEESHARIHWGDGEWLYVCKEHLLEIQQDELAAQKEKA